MPTANSDSLPALPRLPLTRGMVTAPATMNAAVYKGASVVEVETVPVPKIGAGEILIRVEACGICHTDLKKIAYNLLPGAANLRA